MPKKTSLKLNQNRGSRRRKSLVGLAIAASLGLAACSNNGSTGNDDLGSGGGGGDGGNADLSLPGTPPPGSHRVTVTLEGTAGSGSVTSQSGGISCGTGSMQCAGDFTDGTQVVLTAVGANGFAFTGWAGACSGQGAVCTLTISADVATTAKFGTRTCSPDGVCWEAPLPFGYDLNAVAAISPTDVWAVGNAGTAVHYDGQNWTKVATGTTLNLTDLWARNTSDLWATAGAGTMYHYTGTTTGWVKVMTGYPDITTHVWGTPNKVFVTTSQQYALDFDGTTWTKRDTNSGRNDTTFGAITGTANTDVWVFGTDNFIYHFNGTSWSSTRTDLANMSFSNTSGAFAVSTTDVWEVVATGRASRANPPNLGTTGYGFTAVGTTPFAASANGLWGTASNSLFSSGPLATLYHYDGATWNLIPTGVKDVPGTMNKVHGTSSTDVWSVGPRGVIAHYNGTAATVNRGNIFTGSNITAVWASSPTDAWFTTTARTVIHYDGATFTENQPLTTGIAGSLKAVWGTSASDVWAGGFDLNGPLLQHWNGTAWAVVPQPTGFAGVATSVDGIYAASPSVAYAAGAPATGLEKWDGTAWKIDTLGAVQPITKVWGSSETQVFAIEDNTTHLWLYNGAAWSIDTRISANLFSIGGTASSNVWAGGSQGVYHFNGSTWSALMPITGSTNAISSVSAVSATEVWAVDSTSKVFHTTDGGATWKQVDTGISLDTNSTLKSFSLSTNLSWLAGKGGILSIRK